MGSLQPLTFFDHSERCPGKKSFKVLTSSWVSSRSDTLFRLGETNNENLRAAWFAIRDGVGGCQYNNSWAFIRSHLTFERTERVASPHSTRHTVSPFISSKA